GASASDHMSAPANVLDALIALSIAYVAIENAFCSEPKSWRVAVVTACGFLHGAKLAQTLGEIGLPGTNVAAATFWFGPGLQAAQLLAIAATLVLVVWDWDCRAWYHRRVVVPASLAMAFAAIYWTALQLPL